MSKRFEVQRNSRFLLEINAQLTKLVLGRQDENQDEERYSETSRFWAKGEHESVSRVETGGIDPKEGGGRGGGKVNAV